MHKIPIMAIHGSASSGAMWRSLIRHVDSERDILTPDLRGYGRERSVVSHSPSLSDRVMPLLQQIDPQRGVHLVAHSFGCAVALNIVQKAPDWVKSLTLYEPVIPAIFKDCESPEDVSLFGDLMGLSRIMSGTSGQVAMETFINFWHHSGAWSDFTSESRAKLAQLAPVVFRDFQEAMNEPSGVYAGTVFQQPVKIFVGQDTQPHAKRMAQRLRNCLPRAQYQVMEAMGHMGPATHPDLISHAIWQHVLQAEHSAQAA